MRTWVKKQHVNNINFLCIGNILEKIHEHYGFMFHFFEGVRFLSRFWPGEKERMSDWVRLKSRPTNIKHLLANEIGHRALWKATNWRAKKK